MKNSTHQIQWMDPAELIRKEGDRQTADLTRDEERDIARDPLGSII